MCTMIAYFRNFRRFISLLLMDTSLQFNLYSLQIIRKEAVESRIVEAFLESAPQFILQSSIILRTGNISNCYF